MSRPTHPRLRPASVVLCAVLAACSSTSALPEPSLRASGAPVTATGTATPAATGSGTATPSERELEAAVDEAVGDGFRGVVLIAIDGEPTVLTAYGPADESADTPNTPESRFHVGSIQKQFIAAAALVLVDDGILELDASICRWVRECPAHWRPITMHHLLTHTSGIPTIDEDPDIDADEDLVARLAELPLDREPGSEWAYGHEATVVGYIVGRAAERAPDDFIEDRVFGAAGMRHTGFTDDGPPVAGAAVGYVAPGVAAPGTAGLYSTVGDLLAWDRALRDGSVVSGELVAVMEEPHVPTPVPDLSFGYGAYVGEEGGRRLVAHPGAAPGFAAFLERYPDDEAMFAVLSNLESTDVIALRERLVAAIFR